jgi:hypothetical protein
MVAAPARSHPILSPPARAGWRFMAALVPALALSEVAEVDDKKPVPMRDVQFTGSADSVSRRVAIVMEAAIATPLGRIPIRGHIRLTYDCQSKFAGTVSYHPLVRFFAKLKRVDLIGAIDGEASAGAESSCPTMLVHRIHGRAKVDAHELSGWVTLDGDSLSFRGPAWLAGDTAYHSVLSAVRGGRPIEMRVAMFEK